MIGHGRPLNPKPKTLNSKPSIVSIHSLATLPSHSAATNKYEFASTLVASS